MFFIIFIVFSMFFRFFLFIFLFFPCFSLQLEKENKDDVKKTVGKAYTHPYNSGIP